MNKENHFRTYWQALILMHPLVLIFVLGLSLSHGWIVPIIWSIIVGIAAASYRLCYDIKDKLRQSSSLPL